MKLEDLDKSRIPQHVAIIMDGNGRWAQKQQKMRIFGHQNAFTAVRQTVEAAVECGVKYLTLYTFSTDNWTLTDDHGMLIYGIAKDQTGREYYMVKNSWGESSGYNGIWYMSKAYIIQNTMDVMVNKKAVPAEILKKCGL